MKNLIVYSKIMAMNALLNDISRGEINVSNETGRLEKYKQIVEIISELNHIKFDFDFGEVKE